MPAFVRAFFMLSAKGSSGNFMDQLRKSGFVGILQIQRIEFYWESCHGACVSGLRLVSGHYNKKGT